ncbi:MAG: sle [Actinomycetia bacterium]|nr:sle [Actinomycetes bacterium]
MKLAIVAPVWVPVPPPGYGGIELVASLETETLVARGHDVTLFANGESRTSARLVATFPTAPDPSLMGDVWYESLHAMTVQMCSERFDLIHDHSGVVGAALGASRPVVPTVHTLHGRWTPIAERFYPLIAGRVHLVAISEHQRRAFPSIPYAGVVHNGIDVGRYTYVEQKDGYLVYIGRAAPDKDPARAIDLARAAGLPIRMVVRRARMTNKPDEPDEIEYWNREIVPRLGPDVEIFDRVSPEQKVELLAHATAMVFPINWPEPFGLVMVEAMACGTPVVTCPVGAAPEIVVHGVTGFVRPDDAGMVDGIRRIVAGEIDPAACRARVEEHFSAPVMTEGYERIFERVLAP